MKVRTNYPENRHRELMSLQDTVQYLTEICGIDTDRSSFMISYILAQIARTEVEGVKPTAGAFIKAIEIACKKADFARQILLN